MSTLEGAPRKELGLSFAEVEARIGAGQANSGATPSSRPWLAIVRANVLTRFNALLGGLLVVILVIGPPQDALFGVIILLNTGIGVGQELRARSTLDRLALLHEPRARVLRDGELEEVPEAGVVVDDVIDLRRGDQVVVDGEVLSASGLEVDESLLSGEADPVAKAPGERVLSGGVVVAGFALMRATTVGRKSFAREIADEARRFSLADSELQEGNNRILRLITFVIGPVAALLCWSQLTISLGLRDALRGSVAGVANMIPEGLVLLTSLAYAMGALRLARKGVLVRELAAVEGLARVDVLCVDKTGTLTTGELKALEVRALRPDVPALEVVAGLAAAEDTPTASLRSLASLREQDRPPPPCADHVPFSSERRWSGGTFEGLGSFVLGAPEMLLPPALDEDLEKEITAQTEAGNRVLLLGRAPAGLPTGGLPADLEPVALGILSEEVRSDAGETLSYLKSQAVAVKVLSGDNPSTVAAIARRAGISAGDPLDASELPGEAEELLSVMEEHSVFGRVGPREKRAMVAALQRAGHVVAMTGDGVNDVLALHDADLGIAMGSGSPASRAAGRVVLLEDSFSILPGLLAEGRRVLANVERVSKLFVTKTVYTALVALVIGVARQPYPFYPRNFTVISALTIGIPAFFLALPPATTRLRSGYLTRVRSFVVPVGAVMATGTVTVYLVSSSRAGGSTQARTAAALVLATLGLWVLSRLAQPLTWWKVALVGSMAGLFALVLLLPLARSFLAFELPTTPTLVLSGAVAACGMVVLEILWHLFLRPTPEEPRLARPSGRSRRS